MLVVLVVCYCFYFLLITVSSALITVSSAVSSYYGFYFLLITVSSSTFSTFWGGSPRVREDPLGTPPSLSAKTVL